MKFALALLLTAVLAWALGLVLPYWSLSLAAFMIGFLVKPGRVPALLAGLLAGGLLWGLLAWRIDMANASILSTRIGMLFGTGAIGMVAVTAGLGALLAGLGCLLGDRVRHVLP